MIHVGRHWTVIHGVRDAVLIRVGDVACVANAIHIHVGLIHIGRHWTVVTIVANAVVIGVDPLKGIEREDVDVVVHAVVVGVDLLEIGYSVAVRVEHHVIDVARIDRCFDHIAESVCPVRTRNGAHHVRHSMTSFHAVGKHVAVGVHVPEIERAVVVGVDLAARRESDAVEEVANAWVASRGADGFERKP